MTEDELKDKIQVIASRIPRLRLWRNNVMGVKTKRGDWYRAGLPKGSSDLIGVYCGLFVAIEVKVKGRQPSQEQKKFMAAVRSNKGIAFIAREKCGEGDWLEKILRAQLRSTYAE